MKPMVSTFALVTFFAVLSLARAHNRSPTYAQPTEGSINNAAELEMRRPAHLPEAGLYGAAAFWGWTATNNFVRHFFVSYDVVVGSGEFKHGLWSWHMENATIPLWWCSLGGRSTGTDGLADTPTPAIDGGRNSQSNMKAVWSRIDSSPKANKFGPLARAAGLHRLASSAIRVHLHHGAKLWMNRNTSAHPFLTPVTWAEGHFEVYIFRASYGNHQYDTTECPPGTNVTDAATSTCGLQQTHVAVIPSPAVVKKATTFPSWGMAYTRDKKCPKCRGKSCNCDHLLIDLQFSAYLTGREPLELFVPDYMLPPQAVIDAYYIAKRIFRNKSGMK